MTDLTVVVEPTPMVAVTVLPPEDVTIVTAAVQGLPGMPGPPGQDGDPGVGVPPGGDGGQVLAKASDLDYDTHWVTGAAGGGAGSDTAGALIVAASDAPAPVRTGADYVCDGVADQVEINAALAVAAGKAAVLLTGGTFNLSGSIDMNVSGAALHGSGYWNTRLFVSNGTNAHAIHINGANVIGCEVTNLKIDGNKSNNTAGDGIYLNTPYGSGGDNQHFLFNLDIHNSAAYGIHTNQATRVLRALTCRVKLARKTGFFLDGSDAQITNCIADVCQESGFFFESSNIQMIGCKAFYCGQAGPAHAGFYLNSTRGELTGCEAQDNYYNGFWSVGPSSSWAFQSVFTGCVADSNGQANDALSLGASCGLLIESDRTVVVGGMYVESKNNVPPNRNGSPQHYGIRVQGNAAETTITGVAFRNNATVDYSNVSTGTNNRFHHMTLDPGFKAPVRVVTDANVTLDGLQTIDGIVLLNGDRVLVAKQTNAVENGVYTVTRVNIGTDAAPVYAYPWLRAKDALNNGDLVRGCLVAVGLGTLHGDSIWSCTSVAAVPWVPGTTTTAWNKVVGDGMYVDRDGDTMTGNLTVSRTSSGANTILTSPSGYESGVLMQTGGLTRWRVRASSDAESTGNAGSNFEIARYSDAGAQIDTLLTMYRNTGGITVRAPITTTSLVPTSSSHLTSKQYVDARTPQITPSATAPPSPQVNDVWIDLS